jgi:hypothetical protein
MAPVSWYNKDGDKFYKFNETVYCGYTDGTTEFPKLYFTNFTTYYGYIMDSGICVKACPEEGEIMKTDDVYGNKLVGISGEPAYASRDLINICMPINAKLEA